jgi:hypothetical protein
MSSGSSAPKPPELTNAQKYPTSEVYSLDGNQQVSRLYDAGANRFTTNITRPKEDQLIDSNSRTSLANLSTQAMGFQPTQENLSKYQNMLAEPQTRAVNSAFDKMQGNAVLDASGNGMAQSAGMARYLANEIAGKRAESLGDVERDSFLNRGAAMMSDFAPLEQQSNYFNALRQGEQSNVANMQNSVLQGAQAGANQVTTGLNAANSAYQNQLNAYNARQPNFFTKLVGF